VTYRTATFIFLSAITSILVPTRVAQAFTGAGSGTEPDPYIITTVDQLNEIQNELDACYELGNNIDCSVTVGWNAGAGFDPIGTSTGPFTGILDGNNHKITGLFINRSDIAFGVGLFGYIDDSCELTNIGRNARRHCHQSLLGNRNSEWNLRSRWSDSLQSRRRRQSLLFHGNRKRRR